MPETADAGLRLAIYARVSTEEQREGQTIDSQISELERFAREKGWLIAGTYKDEGWSGGVMERPELDRLRDDAQKGVFDAVLINDVDRLARDVAHLGVIKRDLETQGHQGHLPQTAFRNQPHLQPDGQHSGQLRRVRARADFGPDPPRAASQGGGTESNTWARIRPTAIGTGPWIE